MHQIEDEPVHELYSSLVGCSTTTNSSRQTQIHDVSHTAYAAASSTISASYRDNHNPPTLIIKDDKDGSSSEFTPSSTFMKFYRGSCRSISEKQPNPPALANSKNVPSKKSESSGQAAANHYTKSTRSERRQQAKRERAKQIQQERRIRAMLNSDLSEEDEALYNCFHR